MKNIIGMDMKEAEAKRPLVHGPHGPAHGPAHGHPLPPHHRTIVYEEQDMPLMVEIFGDEDSAAASLQDIASAPFEQQMIGYQLFDLIRVLKEVC